MTKKQKMGRPQKVSIAEKLEIVNRYYLSSSGDGITAMQTHGLYSRLSAYAKSLDYPLEPYDFSRDKAVRAHIRDLATSAVASQKQKTEQSPVLPTFVPLDIPALMSRSRDFVAETLSERERYFEGLHINASHAIESYNQLFELHLSMKKELESSQAKCATLEKRNNELIAHVRNTEKDIAYLKRVIRKDVEPEKAHQYLQGLTSCEEVVRAARYSVMSSIDALTRADRNMHVEAENEVDKTDLGNLLRVVQSQVK